MFPQDDYLRKDAIRACLSPRIVVPPKFPLQAFLPILDGHDTIITADTGSGKTLCLLIPLLLRPNPMSIAIAIAISPLERLQTTQARVSECERYRIRTIAINEDTPNDPGLWESIRQGHYRYLIVSPEKWSPTTFSTIHSAGSRIRQQDKPCSR
ncbi:hypothetical protein BS17DRAFT_130767 [Gyrodon lividus]|nr:hypothetical protein BS17DRAFT_130767 [Gyrodon lividus]